MAVVVFGSINLDLILRVPSLPRPGETVLGHSFQMQPGGKGANQALAAKRAGRGEVRLVGCVGMDAFADQALALLAQSEVDLRHVQRLDGHTGVATIAVAEDGQNQIAVASGVNRMLAADAVPDDWLGEDCVLLLQMETDAAANLALAERASALGARIILNVAPAGEVPPLLMDLADGLVMNEQEAQQVAESLGLPAATPVMAARYLAAGRKAAVIVTMGAAGAIAFQGAHGWLVPALNLKPEAVVDTTGAGDAFVGVFGAAIEGGLGFEAALSAATVGGAIACLREGAQPSMPQAEEIAAGLPHLAKVEQIDYGDEPAAAEGD